MVLGDLIQSMLDAPEKFVDVATHDPLSALLVAIGGLIILVSVGGFGLLVLGAIVELIRPDRPGATHPEGR